MTSPSPLEELLQAVQQDIQAHFGTGRVADYIPALARVDPRQFGLALHTCTGERASVGDCAKPFSIQSVSKVFTLTLALGRVVYPLAPRRARAIGLAVQLDRAARA